MEKLDVVKINKKKKIVVEAEYNSNEPITIKYPLNCFSRTGNLLKVRENCKGLTSKSLESNLSAENFFCCY